MNFIIFLSLFFSWTAIAADIPKSQSCKDVIEVLQEGDLVFTSNRSYVFRQVEKDTLSWTSHVGIAFKHGATWMVYESKVPLSKISYICDFINRSKDERVAVTRYSSALTSEQVGLLKFASAQQLNIRYDLGFEYLDSKSMFCSKYVYNAYQTIGIEIGQLETLGSLLLRNPEANMSFWKTWFLGQVPYDRLTITPASQLIDPKFLTIYTSYSVRSL